MDHQHVFRQAGLFEKVLNTVVALCWRAGQGGEWQEIWFLRRHQMMYDVRSLFISTLLLVNFFLEKRTLKQERQGKETSGKGTIMPTSTTRLSCISSSSLLFPYTSFRWPPGPPSSPAGTCRKGTGMSAYRPGLLLPQGSKIMTSLKLFTGYTNLQVSYVSQDSDVQIVNILI